MTSWNLHVCHFGTERLQHYLTECGGDVQRATVTQAVQASIGNRTKTSFRPSNEFGATIDPWTRAK